MQNITNPDWRVLPEFPGYAITSDGQIWSYKSNKFLKPYLTPDRYLTVCLYNDLGQSTCKVHRLVGMAFVKLPPEFNNDYDMATIDHIDGNKLNNHYTNLEWVTREENASRAWENGYCDHLKKSCFCISIEDRKYTKRNSASDMNQYLNLPEGTVTNAINNANGILQGKYIVGYTENLDKKYLLPVPDVDGIIQLYSDTIANYRPHRKGCFYIDSLDNKYHESDSTRGMDRDLNLPIGTVKRAIRRNNGLIRGRYIVGYLDDPRWKGVPVNPTIAQIIESYAEQIKNYKSRNIGPKKITNLQTGESKIYSSLSEFAREKGMDPSNASRHLEAYSDLYRVELA